MSDFNALDLDSLDALLDAADVTPESADAATKINNEQPPDPLLELAVGDTQAIAPELTVPPDTAELASAPEVVDAAPSVSADDDLLAMAPLSAKPEMPLKSELNESPTPAKAPPSLKAGKSTAQWTDAEMDSLKKLIIIFGSILIVLVLTAIGLAAGGLFASPKTDAKLMEQVEAIKNEVGQSYLILEDSGKKTKTMTGQLSDVATQLAEIAEAIEILKTKTASAAPTPAAASGKPMTAAERKAALREEIQHNLANGDAEGDKAADTEVVATPKSEKVVNSAQAEQLVADIVDMKKRLIATQKVLENLQKQSETLQQQSQLVTDTLKSVETDVKALKPVAKVVSAPKAPVVKKVEEKEVAPKAEVKPIKPADDPEWRARWSQQMGKSDGFP